MSCPWQTYTYLRDSLTELPVSVDRCHLSISMYLSINIHSQVPFLVCRNWCFASQDTSKVQKGPCACLPLGCCSLKATCLSSGGPFSRLRIDRFWRGLWDYGSVEGNGNSGQSWDPGAVSSVEKSFDRDPGRPGKGPLSTSEGPSENR